MKRILLLLCIVLVSGCVGSKPHKYKKGKVYKKGYFMPGKY